MLCVVEEARKVVTLQLFSDLDQALVRAGARINRPISPFSSYSFFLEVKSIELTVGYIIDFSMVLCLALREKLETERKNLLQASPTRSVAISSLLFRHESLFFPYLFHRTRLLAEKLFQTSKKKIF